MSIGRWLAKYCRATPLRFAGCSTASSRGCIALRSRISTVMRTQQARLSSARSARRSSISTAYRGEAALYTWFCQVCRNTVIDYRRAHRREHQAIVPLEDQPNVRAILESFAAPATEQPDLQAWRQDVRRLVQATVDRLPDRYSDRARVEVRRWFVGRRNRGATRHRRQGGGVAPDTRAARIPPCDHGVGGDVGCALPTPELRAGVSPPWSMCMIVIRSRRRGRRRTAHTVCRAPRGSAG